jgi:hypothetical protein
MECVHKDENDGECLECRELCTDCKECHEDKHDTGFWVPGHMEDGTCYCDCGQG